MISIYRWYDNRILKDSKKAAIVAAFFYALNYSLKSVRIRGPPPPFSLTQKNENGGRYEKRIFCQGWQ